VLEIDFAEWLERMYLCCLVLGREFFIGYVFSGCMSEIKL